jgi:acyl carrier protein
MNAERAVAAIARALCCSPLILQPHHRLAADLDVDVADKVEVAHEISREFTVCMPTAHALRCKTVQDVLDWVTEWVPAETPA